MQGGDEDGDVAGFDLLDGARVEVGQFRKALLGQPACGALAAQVVAERAEEAGFCGADGHALSRRGCRPADTAHWGVNSWKFALAKSRLTLDTFAAGLPCLLAERFGVTPAQTMKASVLRIIVAFLLCCFSTANAQIQNGKFENPNTLLETPLQPSWTKLIVVIHGWNSDGFANKFTDGEWPQLLSNLDDATKNTDWHVVAYDWSQDASTGPGPDLQGIATLGQSAVNHGSDAAVMAWFHGDHVASAILSDCRNLRQIIVVAHSAGAWAARQTIIGVLNANQYAVGEVVLLDAYTPGAVPFPYLPHSDPGSFAGTLTIDQMSGITSLVPSQRLHRLEHYYANDFTLGTNSTFAWRSGVDIGGQNIDYSYLHYIPFGSTYVDSEYLDHAGPIQLYSDIVAASTSQQASIRLTRTRITNNYDYNTLGWNLSLFRQANVRPGFTVHPQSQPVVSGSSVTLGVSADRTAAATGYTWYKDGVVVGSGATLIVNQAGDYVARASNSYGVVFSDKATISVTNLSTPSGLVSNAISSSRIDLNWTAGASGATGFNIERATSSSGPWSLVANVPSSTTYLANNTGLSSNTTYFYRVKATNSGLNSAPSNIASATTQAAAAATHTLTVNSVNPASGAYIYVIPNDVNGAANGSTPLAPRVFNNHTSVALVATTVVSGKPFIKWQRDGVDFTTNNLVYVTMDADHTMTAVYGAAGGVRTLTGLAINGPASVAEKTSQQYTATAYFSDGSSMAVAPYVWVVAPSTSASMSNSGLLDAGAVTGDTTVSVSTSYLSGGVLQTASKPVTITHTNTSQTYTLTVTADHGRVDSFPARGSYQSGDYVQMAAVADYGNRFTNWTVNGIAKSENPLSLLMDSNKLVTANFAYDSSLAPGTLQVTIGPPGAVVTGARWRIDNGPWQSSGTTVTTINGNHALSFGDASGYITPSPETISVIAGQANPYVRQYSLGPQPAAVQVTLTPADAVIAGAMWRLDGGAWHNSGDTVVGLPEKLTLLEFKLASGWITPAPRNIQTTQGQTRVEVGDYGPPAGVPTLISIGPSTGPISGGTEVVIKGANFVQPLTVTFGGQAAQSLTVDDPTTVRAVTPGRSSYGTVAVTITTPNGQASSANGFTYILSRGTNLDLTGQIGGSVRAATVSGSYAYIGEGTGFVVLDISNPASPSRRGSIALPGLINRIAVSGNFAYVAAGDAGLQVVDVSDKNAPLLVGYFNTTNAMRVAVNGTKAYLIDATDGVYVLDITTGTTPSLLGSLPLGGEVLSGDFGLNGASSLLYVGIKNVGIRVVDVTNPASIQARGLVSTYTNPWDIAVSGTKIYVANYAAAGGGIINAQNPDAPTVQGNFGAAFFRAICVQGSFAYLVQESDEVAIMNVSNPANPLVTNSSNPGQLVSQESKAITVSGAYAYVANGSGGLRVFVVSNTTIANRVGTYAVTGPVKGVAMNGTTALAACNQNGLQVIDASNPGALVRRGSYKFENESAADVAFGSGKAFLMSYSSTGTNIVDVSNPNAPTPLAVYVGPPGGTYLSPQGIVSSNNMAYLAGFGNAHGYQPALELINVSNASSPQFQSAVVLASNGITPKDLAIKGSLAFVAGGEGHGMKIVDVSNASAPVLRGSITSPGTAFSVAVSNDGQTAYLADNVDSIKIVDVSQPTSPAAISNLDMMIQKPFKVMVVGDVLIVGGFWGIFVYDISAPRAPVEIARYHTPTAVWKLASDGSVIYVAGDEAGLEILRLKDTKAPIVAFITPTTGNPYAAPSSQISLTGTASDASGVTRVSWSNDRGGGGDATGTASWSIANVKLASGANHITVTALDASGNAGSALLTVNFTPPDTTPPVVAVTGPTQAAQFATAADTATLNGSAADNIGVTGVQWVNDRGGSGTASGIASWTVSNIPLQPGPNNVSVTASDAAGNVGTAAILITYTPPDTAPPFMTIQFPTVQPVLSTGAGTLNLSGTASDDRNLAQVTWSNDKGGAGTAVGTDVWSVNGIVLQPGLNVITVTAQDAAGNVQTDSLAVTYTPQPVPAITSATSVTATQGQFFSYLVTASNTPGSYDASGLPAGLGMNTSIGLISGIPTATGSSNVTLSASNGGGTGQATLALTVVAPLTVTPSAGPNGSISPATVQTVGYGGSVTFTAIPATGYVVDTWNVNGTAVLTGGATLALDNITANKAVAVSFKVTPITYALNVSATNGGTVSRSPDQASYGAGTVVSLTAIPPTGYVFAGWSGSANGIANPLTVTLDGNKTITGNFVSITTLPLIAVPTLIAGQFSGVLVGTAGTTYLLQTSNDLATWTTGSLFVMPASGLMIVTDPSAGTFPSRYYRAIPNPGTHVLIADGLNDPWALALGGADVYFIDNTSNNGIVKKVPTIGGTVTTLITGATIYDSGSYRGVGALQVAGENIYGHYGGYGSLNIFRAPKIGGALSTIVSPSGGGFIGVIGSDLFYLSGFTALNRIPAAGGASVQLFSGRWIRSSAVDGGSIYFVQYSNKDVLRYDIATASLSTLISGNSAEGGIIIDATYVYLSVGGSIKRVSKGGGAVTTLLSGSDASARVSDGVFVYFTEGNYIKTVPVAGGAVTNLISVPAGSVNSMAVDSTWIYWADTTGGAGAGKIFKRAKPTP